MNQQQAAGNANGRGGSYRGRGGRGNNRGRGNQGQAQQGRGQGRGKGQGRPNQGLANNQQRQPDQVQATLMSILNALATRDLDGKNGFSFGFMATEQDAFPRLESVWPAGLARPATAETCLYTFHQLEPLKADGTALVICGTSVANTPNNESALKRCVGIGMIDRAPYGLEIQTTRGSTNLCTGDRSILDLACMTLPDAEINPSTLKKAEAVVYREVEMARALMNSRPNAIAYWAVRLDARRVVVPTGAFRVKMLKGGFPGVVAQVLASLLTHAKAPEHTAPEMAAHATWDEMVRARAELAEKKAALDAERAYANRTQSLRGAFSKLNPDDKEVFLRELVEALKTQK